MLNTADKGYFISAGILGGLNVATQSGAVVTNPNDVRVIHFYLATSLKVGHVSITVAAAGAVGSTVAVGIYDANGNKLLDSGTFIGGSATTQTLAIPMFSLNPGIYFFAQSASTPTTLTTQNITSSSNITALLNSQTVKKWGTCANSATGAGVLPTVCGSITALGYNPVAAVFEK